MRLSNPFQQSHFTRFAAGGHGFGKHHSKGGGGPGWNGLIRRGRKFTAEDLQLLLIGLLAEAPRHGYELIRALEERSNGAYTPSPGMIYPALTHLEDLGHAVVTQDGNRKSYSLSDTGRAYLEANRERVDLAFARIKVFAKEMETVRRALAGESVEAENGGWLVEYVEARRNLRHALRQHIDPSPEEQRRIAVILKRAVAEIDEQQAPQ